MTGLVQRCGVGVVAALLTVPIGIVAGAGVASAAPQYTCAGKKATIVVTGRTGRGTPRNDVIVVTNRLGATVDGGAGNDLICGGNGNDVLSGGAGNDVIYGGNGNDKLDGGPGNDVLHGGNGNDTITTGGGTDVAFGEAGNDTMVAGPGPSRLDGGAGNDRLTAYLGGRIASATGPSRPAARATGVATLIAGAGTDALTCGPQTCAVTGSRTSHVVLGAGPATVSAAAQVVLGTGAVTLRTPSTVVVGAGAHGAVVVPSGSTFVTAQGDPTLPPVGATVGGQPGRIAPAVTTNPADATATTGQQVTFTAAAAGTPEPSAQWQVSGANGLWSDLRGQTGRTLVVAASPLVDGSRYRAVFTSLLGTATTTAATLTVTYAPQIVTQPRAATAVAATGGHATFTAAAVGQPAVSGVVWRLSPDGGSTWNSLYDTESAFGVTVSISPLANGSSTMSLVGLGGAADGFVVDAVFSNALGSMATQPATLSVVYVPTVTTQPTDVTAGFGIATFTAVAGSNPALTGVTWQLSTDGGTSWSDIPAGGISGYGATISFSPLSHGSTTLTLTGMNAPADGWKVRATFTNGVDSVTTTVATLTVRYAPMVTGPMAAATTATDGTASFGAAVLASPAVVDAGVQWQVSSDGGSTWGDVADGDTIGSATVTVHPMSGGSATLSLAGLGAAQDGLQFRVVVTNSEGSATSDPALLTVLSAPVVTTDPASTTVDEGATATFTGAATGDPLPTLQWQFSTDAGSSWTDLAGKTAATLTLPTVTASQNGHEYRLAATNSQGTTYSAAATLTVDTAPVVTTDPASTTVTAGSSATFTVAGTGRPTPTVQWQVSTDGTTWSDIGGATATTLTLASVAAGDDGDSYRAVLTNSVASTDSAAAVLTVQSGPSFTTNPTSTSASAGSSASFTVSASGNPAPTLQWQVSTDGGGTWSDIGGATATSLTLASVAAGDDGSQYRAVATNSIGSADSTAATLTVHYAPSFTAEPADTTVNEASSATFSVTVAANPAATLQWQVSTDGGSTFTNLAGKTAATLTLTSLGGSENGNQYRAVATNSEGTTTSTAAVLTVDTAPSIPDDPSDQTVTAGSDATFTSSAVGRPAPTAQWQVSTDGGSTWSDLAGETASTLTLHAVDASMNGNSYRVVYTNSVSSATSGVAVLTVS